MLGKCFFVIVAVALVSGVLTGNVASLGNAALDGAAKAIEVTLSLAGMTALWCGVMRVLTECGAVRLLTRVLTPLLRPAFPKAWKDPACRDAVTAAVTANMLGLGNAATPLALTAMRTMREKGAGGEMPEMAAMREKGADGEMPEMVRERGTGGEMPEMAAMRERGTDGEMPEAMREKGADGEMREATDDMVTFAVLGTAPLNLLPGTLIAMRRAAGSAAPYAIVVPVWICSFLCALFGVVLSRVWSAAGRKGRRAGRKEQADVGEKGRRAGRKGQADAGRKGRSAGRKGQADVGRKGRRAGRKGQADAGRKGRRAAMKRETETAGGDGRAADASAVPGCVVPGCVVPGRAMPTCPPVLPLRAGRMR